MRSGDAEILKGRRGESSEVVLPEGNLIVRDQRPLSEGSIRFEGGWGLEDLLHDLSRRVFLWPGTEVGPIDYGQRHAEAYKRTDVLIRMRTQDLLGSEPYFSKYNSGSPRCCGGKKSPRGPNTFPPAEQCTFTAGRVVEVTFLGQLCLPADTLLRSAPQEEWELLFTV
jgi:hypothetical protein